MKLKFDINKKLIWRNYDLRQEIRLRKNIPTLCLVGPGGCGKDTTGLWFHDNTELNFVGSCSWMMAPYVAKAMKLPTQEAYNARRENRQIWRDLIDEMREKDPALVAALCLGTSDIMAGARPVIELEAARAKGMLSLTIWIENPRVPPDPTLEIKEEDCDVVITNGGSLSEYYSKLRRLSEFKGILNSSFKDGKRTNL
jgi:hypothetical protein